ncbi:hypothetical protein GCM10010446_24540 [Streptomyces enissocaesilis]|uniref:Uncharacterized protein n=2 Tax=Streptomyces enissocaesilis TaxID=332589 RepID=A0ABN3X5A0_9ACTN
MVECDRRGTIVSISSVAGPQDLRPPTACAGTRFAAYAMSESLREEVAPYGVRVTVIAPGAVEAELLSHTFGKVGRARCEEWKKTNASTATATVAEAVRYAHARPKEVCVRELAPAGSRQQV